MRRGIGRYPGLAMDATVILVHGAFHGAWCWTRVLKALSARDVPAVALDLPGHGASDKPLGGLAEDAAELRALLRRCGGPVVLCGHSYGGLVITEAADASGRLDHLVYLAAMVPDVGESLVDCVGDPELAPISRAFRPSAHGALVMDAAQAGELFYHDCDPGLARWAVSRLGPHHPASLTAPVTRAAWRGAASTYVVCCDDRAVDARAQERWAKRCRRTLRWPTGHSPMLSRPELLADLLAELAG